jgi:hypothetical protein
MFRRRIRIRLAAGASLAVAVAAAAAVWALWPHPAAAPPPQQARQYLHVTACLLTGPRGVAPGAPAAPVWAAMQSASLASHVMVTYLPDTGIADTTLLLNTLVQRQCGVIVTTGATPAQVIRAAKANPKQRFVLVTAGNAVAAAPSNVAVVSVGNVTAPIKQAIRALAATA